MIEVRAMQKKDIDAVYEIECRSFRTPWSKMSLASELRNQVAHYRVLLIDDKLVGFCGMWVLFDEAHITNIAIHPDFRGRGLGRYLLYKTMEAAISFGADSMTLEVRETNMIAQRMYESFDFTRQGFRPRYYEDTNEGAYLLWNREIAKTVENKTCQMASYGLK
ncbi:MAG: ribosomal protein S18-alanine N-acetyltransferase [Eubacteriales bacterium]|nr:ribosomal protein S18-alanine N-acetyltransferase [Eubacteriales bacterium]